MIGKSRQAKGRGDAMVYRGTVKNGVVVLDGTAKLEEGQPVSVRPLRRRVPQGVVGRRKIPSLYERLKPLIGAAKGLPSDFAAQHDHYLYGTPKRK
jgi:hypothetical protein